MSDGVIMVLLALVIGATGSVAAQSAPDCSTVTYNGDGSGFNPYEVENVDQLQCIEDQGIFADYVQVSDIDASETESWNGGKGFVPIANDTDSSFGFQGTGFTGTFDGSGYNISDLYINRGNTDFVGMFGSVDSAGRVENVDLDDANITGYRFTGTLFGENNGFVTESYADGSVTGSRFAGGLFGWNDFSGIVTESHATVKVETTGDNMGGLVGRNYGTVRESYATGSVSGTVAVGGLIGENDRGTVENSYATGNVTGIEEVGGLFGRNFRGNVTDSHATGSVSSGVLAGGLGGINGYGTVDDSYATGSVDGSADVGGLVGFSEGNVTESYATGSVSGTRYVGGLVGQNYGFVRESYATGSVSAGDLVGGFVGFNSEDGNVTESYATGHVSGGRNVGGFVGFNDGGNVTKSYWDIQSSGMSSSDGGTGLTTPEMIGTAATSNMTGFEFTDTWMTVTDPVDYPILAWQSREDGGTGDSPVEDVSDELWTAVTQDDGEDGLSLADLGNAIQEYQNNPGDADIDGVSIDLSDLGSLIRYYGTETA